MSGSVNREGLKIRFNKETYTLPAGSSKEVIYQIGQGLLEGLVVSGNQKKVRTQVTTDGHTSSYTFEEAYNAGFIFPAGQNAYLTKYDEDAGVFVAVWAPVPVLEFKRQFGIKIINEDTATAIVTVQTLIWTEE